MMKYKVLFTVVFYVSLLLEYNVCRAQMVEGEDIPEFGETFGIVPYKHDYTVAAVYMQTNIPGNIMWPGDNIIISLQLVNSTNKTVVVNGVLETIAYGTKGNAGDIWTPAMFKIRDEDKQPFTATIKAHGFTNIHVKPATHPVLALMDLLQLWASMGGSSSPVVYALLQLKKKRYSTLLFASMIYRMMYCNGWAHMPSGTA